MSYGRVPLSADVPYAGQCNPNTEYYDPPSGKCFPFDAAKKSTSITNEPWFWPAALGGGALVAVLLFKKKRSR